MPLTEFNQQGDLPEGVHQASLDEVIARFGSGTPQRAAVTQRLVKIYRLAQATGRLKRFIIFGSYITGKPSPNDVDILLVMDNEFALDECDEEARVIFYHDQVQKQLGASVFWITEATVLMESVAEFIAYWQIKRDSNKRGIVEVEI